MYSGGFKYLRTYTVEVLVWDICTLKTIDLSDSDAFTSLA